MTWVLTRTGRVVSLLHPAAHDIDFVRDVAPSLALIRRFNGHAGPEGRGYSVAQHCCLGARAIYAETRSPRAALAFLLRDAHKAYLGDITSPVIVALDRAAVRLASGREGVMTDAKRILADRLDRAIHEAADLAFPLPEPIAHAVSEMDIRLVRRERDDLLPPTPLPWGPRIEAARPLPAIIPTIEPMPPADAATAWLTMFDACRQAKRAEVLP